MSMQLPSQKKVSTKSLQCKNCTPELDFPKIYYAKLELNSVPSEHKKCKVFCCIFHKCEKDYRWFEVSFCSESYYSKIKKDLKLHLAYRNVGKKVFCPTS